jgi:hypothetical protein
MGKIIFAVVLLHIVVGFGWVLYKLQFQKKKPKNDSEKEIDNQ